MEQLSTLITADASEPRRLTIKLSSLIINAFADSSGGRVETGRKLSQRSRSAILVVGQDEIEHYFVFKAWIRHCTTDELINEIFLTDEQWQPRVFSIDATGTQSLFVDSLHREAREKGKRDRFADYIFTGDKDYRIETTLQPLQASGKLFVLDGLAELQQEYQSFPGSRMKDGLDALAGCIATFPRRPKEEEARREIHQYREYIQTQRRINPAEVQRSVLEAFEEARDRREWLRETGNGGSKYDPGGKMTLERWREQRRLSETRF